MAPTWTEGVRVVEGLMKPAHRRSPKLGARSMGNYSLAQPIFTHFPSIQGQLSYQPGEKSEHSDNRNDGPR